LYKLRDAVAFCREKAAELEKELASHAADDPGYHTRQFRAHREQEERLAAAALVAEIASITI
jgi:hypothetical protein